MGMTFKLSGKRRPRTGVGLGGVLLLGAAILVADPAVAQNLVLTPVVPADVGRHSGTLTVGDFNGDGWLDVATVNSGSDDVTMLFDDATLDLLVAETGSDGIVVLLGNGDGLFQQPTFYPSGKGPTFLELGDLDRDGDVVVINSGRFGNYPP